MRRPKNALKRIGIITVLLFVAMLLPTAAFAAYDCNLTASEPNGAKLTVGNAVTLTASIDGATADTKYEFWVRDGKSTDPQGGWTAVRGYEADNTYTYNFAKPGTYVFVAYAKTGDAAPVRSDKLYYLVDSSPAITSAVYSDGKITASASSENVNEPLFDWWVKDPNGNWTSVVGHFTTDSTVTIDAAAPGTYQVVANVTDLDFYELLIMDNLDLWNQIKPFVGAYTDVAVQPSSGLDVVESVQMQNLMPGVYVAKITLKEGTTTDDVTASINGTPMTAREDKTGFFLQVNTATAEAVVSKQVPGTVQQVAIPDGTLEGLVASTTMQNLMPGVNVAKITLAEGVTTDDVTASIDGTLMTAREDKTGFFLQVSANAVTADITGPGTTVSQTVTIQ